MKITIQCQKCGDKLATVYRYRPETTVKVKPECKCQVKRKIADREGE